jgi:hypothetical protein
MHLNLREPPANIAANDNNPTWIDDLETKSSNIDLSDYVVRFSPEMSAHLGLGTTEISFGYFEYLLDGHVADEDEQASQRLGELMDMWAGPGWR